MDTPTRLTEIPISGTLNDETRLKALLKEALAELLEQWRERFSALMAEKPEDSALV
jgi:hypothetical protein